MIDTNNADTSTESLLPPGNNYCMICGSVLDAEGYCTNPDCFMHEREPYNKQI